MTLILAHAGWDGSGFVAGFSHPILGLDHLFLALAVGLLASQIGGRARWLLPAAFVGGTAIGGVLARWGWAMPGVEVGIAASLLAAGLAIACRRAGPAGAFAAAVAVLALFHGHAHLSESTPGVGVWSFAAGLLVATALLHVVGLRLATAAGRLREWPVEPVRAFGGFAFAFGVLKMIGVV